MNSPSLLTIAFGSQVVIVVISVIQPGEEVVEEEQIAQLPLSVRTVSYHIEQAEVIMDKGMHGWIDIDTFIRGKKERKKDG